ncbi:hypothetical protein C8R43DRAFT_1135875 [Mycena crocata]|nr:hypothetical protein C8R43DRAFT_1135875 [Mycena crocata]
MAASPSDINALTLGSATGDLLKFWITEANKNIPEKSQRLTKTGKVDELRRKLAAHHNIDLSSGPDISQPMVALSIDENIAKKQWEGLRALGREWQQDLAAGRTFRLKKSPGLVFPPTVHTALQELPSVPAHELVGIPPLDEGSITEETVFAWLGAHSVGNRTALLQLHLLKNILKAQQTPGASTESLPVIAPASSSAPIFTPNNSANPVTNSSVSNPPGNDLSDQQSLHPPHSSAQDGNSSSDPVASGDTLLGSASAEIAGLGQAENLRTAILQVENGEVAKLRERYGPKNGSRGGADPLWSKMNVMVTRRERLFKQLQEEFQGDKDSFFLFFTVTGTSKKSKKSDTEKLRPFRKVVEAIPHRDKDLKTEKEKSEYNGADGNFSDEIWTVRWSGLNSWEIWRKLGLEKY